MQINATENAPSKNQYIPGVCNIGAAEIKKRKQAGWVGLVATVVLWIILIYLNALQPWRLLLFFPVTMSASGFLQAFMHFCAYFGFAAFFNFGDVGKNDTVQQAEFRIQDKRKAWQILIYSIIIGIVVSAFAFTFSV